MKTVFQDNPLSQYIWESPLKIFLLKILSTNSILAIGLVFITINILPTLGIFFNRKTRFYKLTSLLILFTPIFKICFQNIGLGDGFTILMSILLVLLNDTFSYFILILLLGLWHPGQATFIVISALISKFLKEKSFYNNQVSKSIFKGKRNYVLSSIISLIISRFILNIYNMNLGFNYLNRFDYLINKAPDFIIYNIIHSPISLIVPFLFIILVVSKLNKINYLTKNIVIIWILTCSITSILTTDVTRVVNIILIPLYLSILESIGIYEFISKIKIFEFNKKNIFIFSIIIFIAFLPNYGWDGINFTMWDNFFDDICKYGFYCLNKSDVSKILT